MAAEALFLKDPLAFLKNNLVVVVIPSNLPGYKFAASKQFKFEAADPKLQAAVRMKSRFFRKTTKDIDLYYMKEDANDPISAYWLPYGDNQVFSMNLGVGANVMFTPRMDGCSFGYKDNGNGTYTVTHLNFKKTDGSIDDVASKVRLGTLADHTLHMKDYRTSILHKDPNNDAVKITTIGLRQATGEWEFYYQKYETGDVHDNQGYIYHGLTMI